MSTELTGVALTNRDPNRDFYLTLTLDADNEILSCMKGNSGDGGSSPNTQKTETGAEVLPTQCGGEKVQAVCSKTWYVDITFSTPFQSPPKGIVTPANISTCEGCYCGATDKIVALARNVTTTGFRLYCSGSPTSDSPCVSLKFSDGTVTSSASSRGTCSWVATGN